MTSEAQEIKSETINIDSVAAKSKCYMVAGSGGGFSGQVIQYYIFSTGDVYRTKSLSKESTLFMTLSKKQTKNIFKKLKALQLEKMDFNHPGNMTYFIEQHKKENVHTVKWGDNAAQVPSNVSAFYKELMDTITKK